LYSLSWFPNTNFTDIFPSQQEVLEYLGRVARTYDVPRHTQLRTDFVGAQWIEKSAVWRVHLRDLESGVLFVHEAKILVEALGGYCNPKTPSLAGIENFEGTLVHTATWDKSHDLRGKNVVVIGNGCESLPARLKVIGANACQALLLKWSLRS
jgi:cation diffusion facilitator CzcD-associated flavoprotein CzcO